MNNRHLYIVAAVLAVFGLGLFTFKVWVLGYPLQAVKTADRWDVQARVSFEGRGEPARVELGLPRTSPGLAIQEEQFVSRGFGLSTRGTAGSRYAIWTQRRVAGPKTLYYRAVVQTAKTQVAAATATKPPQPMEIDWNDAELVAAQDLLGVAKSRSSDPDSEVDQLLQLTRATQFDDAAAVLLPSSAGPVERLLLVARLLALDGMAARVVHGIQLVEARGEIRPQPWLRLYIDGAWRGYDPITAEPGMPEHFLLLGSGEEPMLAPEGVAHARVVWSARQIQEPALVQALAQTRQWASAFVDYSLLALPIETQQVYRVLLLIPLGALLLALLRNVVGIRTFGTFMPVLIALAFRETQLAWGIVLFSVLVGLGLAVRFYLEQLRLLVVPRLAAVLTVVVILMALISIFSHKLDLERGLSVALFPMVIIAMTIERMSVVWDERGAADALRQGVGSLLAAVAAYLVMFNPIAEYLAITFPELLLLVLALNLLLGRYSGYRLLELGRFKALAKSSKR